MQWKVNEKYRNGVSEKGKLLKLLEKFEARPLSEDQRKELEKNKTIFLFLEDENNEKNME